MQPQIDIDLDLDLDQANNLTSYPPTYSVVSTAHHTTPQYSTINRGVLRAGIEQSSPFRELAVSSSFTHWHCSDSRCSCTKTLPRSHHPRPTHGRFSTKLSSLTRQLLLPRLAQSDRHILTRSPKHKTFFAGVQGLGTSEQHRKLLPANLSTAAHGRKRTSQHTAVTRSNILKAARSA